MQDRMHSSSKHRGSKPQKPDRHLRERGVGRSHQDPEKVPWRTTAYKCMLLRHCDEPLVTRDPRQVLHTRSFGCRKGTLREV